MSFETIIICLSRNVFIMEPIFSNFYNDNVPKIMSFLKEIYPTINDESHLYKLYTYMGIVLKIEAAFPDNCQRQMVPFQVGGQQRF